MNLSLACASFGEEACASFFVYSKERLALRISLHFCLLLIREIDVVLWKINFLFLENIFSLNRKVLQCSFCVCCRMKIFLQKHASFLFFVSLNFVGCKNKVKLG